MKQIDWIKEAAQILNTHGELLPSEACKRAEELLLAEVDEEPSTETPPKMTDARWHEYALAAIGAVGNILKLPTHESILRSDLADDIVVIATNVADRMLEAAEEREK